MEDHIEYEHEVRLGIQLLDAKGPRQWRSLIRLRILDMQFQGSCVVGQIYGDYDYGRGELGISREQAVKLGFERPKFITDDKQFVLTQWEALTAEWRRQLTPSSWLTRLKNFICGKEGCRT